MNYPDPKIKVIPNPVQGADPVIGPKKKQILYVGRLSYADKRVDRLVDIWGGIASAYPDWELIIVGDGPEKENLVKQSHRYPQANISFKGYCTDVAPFFKEASIVCLTSTSEAWGLSLTQAQFYGAIPVAYGCSAGVRSILSPSGTHGILVDPYDDKCFSRELSRLIENDSLRYKMQQSVLKKGNQYVLEAIGGKWNDLFEELNISE